jgi:hypothetical protein
MKTENIDENELKKKLKQKIISKWIKPDTADTIISNILK